MDNIHYIYKHIRLDKNEVFYIGKGTHTKKTYNYYRAYQSSRRNNIWNNIVAKTEWIVEIMYTDLSSEDCFSKEIELIRLYGKIHNNTGTLANYTDGGEGQLRFHKNSTAQIQAANMARQIAWRLPKTTKQLEAVSKNISAANPPKAVMQYDLAGNIVNEFISMSDAARHLNVNHGNISMCCNGKRDTAYNFIWKFK